MAVVFSFEFQHHFPLVMAMEVPLHVPMDDIMRNAERQSLP